MSDVVVTCAAVATPARHRDDGRWLRGFLGDRCDVRCPRCGQRGVVRYATDESRRTSARFACGACACTLHSAADNADSDLSSAPRMWHGKVRLHGRRVCGYCGARWLRHDIIRHASKLTSACFDTTVDCHACGRRMPLKLQALRIRDDAMGCEPVFGLSLALAEPVMPGKSVWAYNRAHLAELKVYIAAQLRERRQAGSASYFSRLPTWIKSARNRAKVMKAIAKIERGMAVASHSPAVLSASLCAACRG